MKKLALFIITVFMLMGISASADTSSEYVFKNYNSISEVYPGRLFHMYTKTAPELTKHNSVGCLKIGSQSNADNILLMNSNSFTDGEINVSFAVTVDKAPNVNWGLAPHIIIRYKNAAGSWVNDTIIEYAYSVIRVRDNGEEVKVGNFWTWKFNECDIKITREGNVYTVVYSIDGKTYTKNYETCDNSEICVGFFSYLGNAMYLKDISFEETYSAGPSAQEVKADFNQKNPSHPRIMVDGEKLGKIRNQINSDSKVAQWYTTIKQKATAALDAPVSKYELRDGERLLYVSRDVYANSVYPAFVYLMEGDKKYFDRALSELNAAAEFADWHPEHFLDTAEMTLAFALCYDWLYNDLDNEQKSVLRTAIKEKGLDAALGAYENTATYDNSIYGAQHSRIGWKNEASNWGLVCNGGIAAGAMAIMGDYDTDYCSKILEDAFFGIEKPISVYTSDGAWSEGVGYWHYATQYLSYMMSSSLNTLGSTYGFMDADGIKNAAQYLIAHTGPKGVFNYGDCSESVISAPELFFLSDVYSDAKIAAARLSMMERFNISATLDDILYYNQDVNGEYESFDMDYKSDEAGVVTSSNSNESPLAYYIGFKSGKIGVSHGDLDAGSFVIDALGVRWASDYGSDDYNLDGYFEWTKRINYFRKRAEGHSTLVINPDGGADQKPGADTKITYYNSDKNGMKAVADLSEAYADDAQSVRRLVSFDGVKFTVQDEVKAQNPSDVYWFMQTKQSVSISVDKRTVTLSSGNKRMRMSIDSNCPGAKFSVTPAKPLSTSPNPAGQATNTGYLRICVLCEDVTDLNLRITLTPYIVGQESNIPKPDAFMSIDEEINVKKGYAYPDMITFNGKKFEDFNPMLHYYEVEDERLPIIDGISDKYEVSVRYGDITEVSVKDITGECRDTKYYFLSSGDTKRDVYTDMSGDTVKIYLYDNIADVYVAEFDAYGRPESIRVIEDVTNMLETEKGTPNTRMYVWDNFEPMCEAISFNNAIGD